MDIVYDPTENLLFSLLSDSLFDTQLPTCFEGVDYSRLWHESHKHAVELLIFSRFPVNLLNSNEYKEVKSELKSRFSSSLEIWRLHAKLHELLTDAGIPYVFLKGCASADYYKDPLMRCMGDVDFFVDRIDIDKAVTVLLKAGFIEKKGNRQHHKTFVYSGVDFELHSEPPGVPSGDAGEVLSDCFLFLIKHTKPCDTPFGTMMFPSALHHGLLLLLHSAHHLTSDGLGLRHLADWAVFISSMSVGTSFEALKDVLRSSGLVVFADLLTSAAETIGCNRVFFGEEPDDETAKELFYDIFSSGNFGQKKENRQHEMLLTVVKSRDSGYHSYVGKLFDSANTIVVRKWPAAASLPFLYPIGWLFFGLRYIIRSIFGKRASIHVKQVITNASSRNRLYEKLHLFEKECE